MWTNRLSLKTLAAFARSLGIMLHSGVALSKALETAAGKTPHLRLSAAVHDISKRIRSGSDLTDAVEAQHLFPELFVDMVRVAEQTGSLPETLQTLADHYENLDRLHSDFISQITYPVLQLLAAIGIIALVIYIMGWIAQMRPDQEVFDFTGLGLQGTTGALIWLGGWALLGIAGYFGYQTLSRSLTGNLWLHKTFLGLPVVGKCVRDFAIARFAWAFHLTQNSGMEIRPSIESSLKATANQAFVHAGPVITSEVMEGSTFSEALMHSQLFPNDFLQMVSVAETSGTVPEMLERMGPQFADQARRSLKMLTTALGWAIWACVAAMIIFFIFRFALAYVGQINSAADSI